MTTPDRISEIYHRALERAPEERSAYLDEACAGDDTLRSEIETLLRYDAASFSRHPPRSSAPEQTWSDVVSALTPSVRHSVQAAWVRSIARTTPGWVATSRSRSCRPTSHPIQNAERVSHARRACLRHSVIPTSARSTDYLQRSCGKDLVRPYTITGRHGSQRRAGTSHQRSMPAGAGLGVTSASTSLNAHLMAPVIIACISGLSQFASTCPSVV
jgi:hypothetical protein